MNFREFCGAIMSPDLQAVAEHWNEARADRALPGWKDLSPKRIAKQLTSIWSYTYNFQGDEFTGRLAGDRIVGIFGKTFRGVPMSQIYPTKDFPKLFDRCKRVINEPSLFHGHGMVFMHLGRPARGERIILPLGDDGMCGDGVLGATVYPTGSSSANSHLDFQEECESWFALTKRDC